MKCRLWSKSVYALLAVVEVGVCLVEVEVTICNVDGCRNWCMHYRVRSKLGYLISTAVVVGVCKIDRDRSFSI